MILFGDFSYSGLDKHPYLQDVADKTLMSYVTSTPGLSLLTGTIDLQQLSPINNITDLSWYTALCLIELSAMYQTVSQYEEALETLNVSYSLLETIGDCWGMVFSLRYSCRILVQQKDLSPALKYLRRAYEIALESENISAILGVMLETAYYLREIGKLKQSLVLTSYVQNHDASYSIEVSRVQGLLEELQATMLSINYAKDYEKGKSLSNSQALKIIHQTLDTSISQNGRHPHDLLTTREHDVLAMIATAMSTSEIAHTLSITKGTLRNHLKRIYSKLGAHSRVQAISHAKKYGLL